MTVKINSRTEIVTIIVPMQSLKNQEVVLKCISPVWMYFLISFKSLVTASNQLTFLKYWKKICSLLMETWSSFSYNQIQVIELRFVELISFKLKLQKRDAVKIWVEIFGWDIRLRYKIKTSLWWKKLSFLKRLCYNI